jgi:hypothetical protein
MENLEGSHSWSIFYAYRKRAKKLYPSVYDLKIRKKLLDIIVEELHEGAKVLDVGASTRALGEKIIHRFPSVTFKTMDIDRVQHHDYYSLDEISESFDMIILSEVIEHLEFNKGISMLRRLQELLNDGGKIIISTPNLYHPNRYWVSDHITPYRYDEIAGALLLVGFTINNIYRTYNDQFFRKLFRIHVASYLHKYLDVDFAKSIIVVASRK